MEIKKLETNGITYLQQLEGCAEWYWGSDYVHGDLYEAEELFRTGHRIDQNDLILVHWPDGALFRPVPKREGRYFGMPLWHEGRVILLLADFKDESVSLMAFSPEGGTEEIVTIPLSETPDCYNLMPHGSPLMITRSTADRFQIIWPEKLEIETQPSETFWYRDGGKLYFSRWVEDPDYREETVVKDLEGNTLEVLRGSILLMPDGQFWHLG